MYFFHPDFGFYFIDFSLARRNRSKKSHPWPNLSFVFQEMYVYNVWCISNSRHVNSRKKISEFSKFVLKRIFFGHKIHNRCHKKTLFRLTMFLIRDAYYKPCKCSKSGIHMYNNQGCYAKKFAL